MLDSLSVMGTEVGQRYKQPQSRVASSQSSSCGAGLDGGSCTRPEPHSRMAGPQVPNAPTNVEPPDKRVDREPKALRPTGARTGRAEEVKAMAPVEPRPQEVAPGVCPIETGRGITEANVYLVRSRPAWVLVDTAWPGRAGIIRAAAETPFGLGTCPAAILLTHFHPDHGGSALELARMWELPVHVHPDDLWVTTLFERLAIRATSTSALAQC